MERLSGYLEGESGFFEFSLVGDKLSFIKYATSAMASCNLVSSLPKLQSKEAAEKRGVARLRLQHFVYARAHNIIN